MEQADLKYRWPVSLAVRKNLLPSSIPYIPILIEDIPQYVSLSDYKENGIRTVQTIGEILPGTIRLSRLRSLSSNSDVEITLNLTELPINTVYFEDSKGRRLHIWVKQ